MICIISVSGLDVLAICNFFIGRLLMFYSKVVINCCWRGGVGTNLIVLLIIFDVVFTAQVRLQIR